MRRLAASVLMWLPALHAIAELTPFPATVAPIRAFGHQLGDVVEQRVRLEADGGPFAVAEMPALGRVGNWFARRSVAQVDDIDGHGWLVLRYQLINAPPQLQVVTLPGLTLDAAGGGRRSHGAAAPVVDPGRGGAGVAGRQWFAVARLRSGARRTGHAAAADLSAQPVEPSGNGRRTGSAADRRPLPAAAVLRNTGR